MVKVIFRGQGHKFGGHVHFLWSTSCRRGQGHFRVGVVMNSDGHGHEFCLQGHARTFRDLGWKALNPNPLTPNPFAQT